MGWSRTLPFKSLFNRKNSKPFPCCDQPKTSSYRCLDSTECYVEAAKQAMSTKRLFFDGMSKELVVGVPFEGSVAVEVESKDLYGDFLDSMKEMVEVNFNDGEVKDLDWLEEMLEWYLRMNKRWTHEFIIGAYCDLLLEMGSITSLSSYFSCLSEIE